MLKWNGGSTHKLNAGTNSPGGRCWVGFEPPVFLTIFSVALEGYVCPTASLSVNSCLELTLWLTDAPINHRGQGGTDAISHLIDSSGKKNSLLEWETVSLRRHWFWFTSIYFHQLQTGIWGLGRRTPLCVSVFFFIFFIIPRVARGHFSHFWQCSLTSGLKKKRPTSTKQGRQRTTGSLHDKTPPKVLMMNFKS